MVGDSQREDVGDGTGVASRAFIRRLDVGIQAGEGSFHPQYP